MALTGSDIWLATALAQVVWLGMVLVRRMDWVNASPMAFRSAVSFVHAARSTLLMIVGATKAARMAMTASTTMVSINVQPARSRSEAVRVLPASCRHNEAMRDRTICRQDAGSTLT